MSLKKYMGRAVCRNCGRPPEEGEGWEQSQNFYAGAWMHKVCPEKVCKKQVNRGDQRWADFRACGRDGKEQNNKGEWLCGIHLAALKRVQKNDAARAEYRAQSDANKERAETVKDILQELNITVSAEYRFSLGAGLGRYTGNVVIDAADLLKLAGISVTLPPRID